MNFRSLVPFAAVFLFGLLAAGLVLLVASQPRGEAVRLIPPPTEAPLMIQVGGEVAKPGVYQLPVGSRMQDAIQAAGGFSAIAEPDSVNLAAKLVDGTRIIVLSKVPDPTPLPPSQDLPSPQQPVDLNTANQQLLETLPGLGPSKARAIIEYRQDHGAFATLDDLDKVPGIGSGILEQIKPYLVISPGN